LPKIVFLLIELVLSRFTDLAFAVSHAESTTLRKLRRMLPVVLLPNTSPMEREIDTLTAPKTHVQRVVMSGRITEVKAPEWFAEIALTYRAINPEVEFVWAGDGDTNLTHVLISAGVRVTGWLTPSELADLLVASRIYLHTSSSEGFPISVIDAAFCGLPILVRRIDAFNATPLQTFSSPEQASYLIEKVLTDANFRVALEQRSILIKSTNSIGNVSGIYVQAISNLLRRDLP
jgi:glycosyltransferase involved in cell wall biosynthesis